MHNSKSVAPFCRHHFRHRSRCYSVRMSPSSFNHESDSRNNYNRYLWNWVRDHKKSLKRLTDWWRHNFALLQLAVQFIRCASESYEIMDSRKANSEPTIESQWTFIVRLFRASLRFSARPTDRPSDDCSFAMDKYWNKRKKAQKRKWETIVSVKFGNNDVLVFSQIPRKKNRQFIKNFSGNDFQRFVLTRIGTQRRYDNRCFQWSSSAPSLPSSSL